MQVEDTKEAVDSSPWEVSSSVANPSCPTQASEHVGNSRKGVREIEQMPQTYQRYETASETSGTKPYPKVSRGPNWNLFFQHF